MSEVSCPLKRGTDMSDKEISRETLEETHDFPCEYTFKVIGEKGEGFADAAKTAAIDTLGESALAESSTRDSSGGAYVSVTLRLEVQSAKQIEKAYESFKNLEQLKFVL